MIKNIKWLFLVSLTFIACNDSDDDAVTTYNSSDGQPLTAGSANFSKYVALGDSYAAGFSDNALFFEGQRGSYPVVLSQQFALVGGGEFKVPFMADNIGGFVGGNPNYGSRLSVLGMNPDGTPIIGPISGSPTTNPTTILTGLYNNMGVPGAKCVHLDYAGYGSALGNPYFARFASNPTATIVDDAIAQSPTFFSLWIGGNDVLGYAASGGLSSNPITPPATFDLAYNNLINKLTAGGRKGVIANLPYINTLPLFTTVKYNAANLNSTQVSALNSGYLQYNTAIGIAQTYGLISAAEKTARTINFTLGANALVIIDENLTTITIPGIGSLPNYRQATAQDLILLSSGGVGAQSHLLAGNGTQFPLTDQWVLTATEVLDIKTATDAYNTTIQNAASTKQLAFVDTKAVMNQIASSTGYTANNYTVTSAYFTGGGFSLDGVHPSPRGYALIANKFLEAINATYGSNLKGVDLSNYRIMFPPVL